MFGSINGEYNKIMAQKRWRQKPFYPFNPPSEEESQYKKGDPFSYGKKKNQNITTPELLEWHKNRNKDSQRHGYNPVLPGSVHDHDSGKYKVLNGPQEKKVFIGKRGWVLITELNKRK